MTNPKHGEMTVKHCPKCGTKLQVASGIGPYCPNLDCRIVDNILNPDEPLPKIGSPVERARQEGWKAGMEEAARGCDKHEVSILYPPRDGWTVEHVEELMNSVAPTLAENIRARINEGK